MKKLTFLFLICAISFSAAYAAEEQIKFKDVPDNHWAASAIYDLVKLGVTKGYPDGTFRGTKTITRFETAVFLSKLAQALGASSNVKDELDVLRKEVEALKTSQKTGAFAQGAGMPLSGDFLAGWKFGNLLSETQALSGGERGAIASYRLKLSAVQNINERANIILNLDTMDYGFMDDNPTATTGGRLASELLDIESNLTLDLTLVGIENPVNLKMTYGPGAVQHSADPTNCLPSEVGVVYVRPDTGVYAATNLWGMDVSGGYIAKGTSVSGKIDVSQITGTFGITFAEIPVLQSLRVETTGDYLSKGLFSSETRDMRAKISLAAPIGEKVSAQTTVGISGSENSKMMVEGAVNLNDIFDTGTVASIRLSKIGTQYLDTATFAEEFDMAGLDTFNRPLENGTVNLGGSVEQVVTNDVKLIGRGDLRLLSDNKYEAPKGRLTAEGGISYAIAPNTTFDATYRIHQDKVTEDTSDVASIGLMYNF